MKPLILALLIGGAASHQAQTLIDVSFPDGSGTNPGFSEIDNGVGTNIWTQTTGILSSSTANNSSIGAASDTTIDFATLGSDSLVLHAVVSSVTGTSIANGIFVGFQRRINDGTGADLWNNLPTSFGLVMPGSANVGNGTRAVAAGGNAGAGKYQASGYGVATLASIQDGFTMTLTVDSVGWELALNGLETSGAVAITGGSGVWGVDGINEWADFNDDMRVGTSYQTNTGAGDLTLASISLVIESDVDTDEDGMPDSYEDANGLDKNNAADADQGADDGLFDNDGLTNLEEYNGDGIADFNGGTDPNDPDRDNDNLTDGQEVFGTLNPWTGGTAGPLPGERTDPFDSDSDNDGLTDGEELDNANGSVSDPNSEDSDFDNMDDGYEVANNLDPTDPDGDNGEFGDPDADGLENGDELFETTDPQNPDTDNDGLTDGEEFNGTLNPWSGGELGTPGGDPTDPLVADTDLDGINDFVEINNGNGSVTDPNNEDSDGDFLLDGFEIAGGLDPTDGTGDNGTTGDPDADLVSNEDEQFYGSAPNKQDTDEDTLRDDVEIFTHSTDPALPDTDGDLIRDDEEVVAGADTFITDPLEGDTDFDTFKDHIEIEAGSDPTDPDSTPTFPAITWSAEAFDAETDISTEGTLLFADNLQGGDVTINGIPFTGYVVDGTGRSTPQLQTLLDTSSPPQNTPGLYDGEVPALVPLLSVFWFQGSPDAVNMGITGLTPGKSYLVQVGRADDRGGDIVNRFMIADGYGGNNTLDPIGPTNTTYGGPDNPAVLFTGTFTAAHTVQVFSWEQYLGGATPGVDAPLGSHLPFIQVREIETITEIVVTNVHYSASRLNVSFTGLDPAKSYQLTRSADLLDGFPTVVDGPRAPAGAADTFTDPGATDAKAFYQLEEMP